MFKRVEKRQLKKEKEQELGLDEEMKQVLGLHDTDSDESFDSTSDSDSGKSDMDADMGEENGDDVSVGDEVRNMSRKRKSSIEPHLESFEGSNEGAFTRSHLFATKDSMDYEDDPPMGVLAVTTTPIYDIPEAQGTQPQRACILCPGKLLKNTHMVAVHVESTAHLRRLQRYTAHVSKLTSSPAGLDTDDPRVVLREMDLTLNPAAASQSRDDSSKRSQRRNAWKSKQTERRKARRRTKVEKSDENGKGEATSVDEDGNSEISGKVRKRKELDDKEGGSSEIVPASITVNLSAPMAGKKLQDRDGGSVPKQKPARVAESSKPDHPTKRRKSASFSTAPSSTAPSVDANPVVKSHSKNGGTSVDKTRLRPLVKRRKLIHGTTENEAQKVLNRQSPDPNHAKVTFKPLYRRDRRDISKGRGNYTEKPRGRSRIKSRQSKAKGSTQKPLSAEQWGHANDLNIFD